MTVESVRKEGWKRTKTWPLWALRNVGRNLRIMTEGKSSFALHHAMIMCLGLITGLVGMAAMDLSLSVSASRVGGLVASVSLYGLVAVIDRVVQRRDRWLDHEMPFYGIASFGVGVLLLMVPNALSAILPFGPALLSTVFGAVALMGVGFFRRSAA